MTDTTREKCPHCGAPCRKEVLMRGGDNGWGDDESRTVYRFSPPADRASGGEVTEEMFFRAWSAYQHAECKPYTDHRMTRLRAALTAALAAT